VAVIAAVATAADSVVATLAATLVVATTSQPTKNPSDLFLSLPSYSSLKQGTHHD
jgi:SH3-like domain-containing protein